MSTRKKLENVVRVAALRRKIAIGIVGVCILVAGGFLAWKTLYKPAQVQDKQTGTSSKTQKDDADLVVVRQDTKRQGQALDAIRQSKAAEAQKSYDDAVAAEPNIERKINLYLDLSEVYYAAEQYDKAFEVAHKAEPLGEDKFLVADWLSRLYMSRKNYVTAAKYYRMAAQYVDSPSNTTGLDKAFYDAEANRMDQLAG